MKGIKHYIKTIKNLLRIHGFAKDAYFTYHYRPKCADEVEKFVPESVTNVCIVIQGPLKKEDDFSFETIKLYKKYYPNTPIVVSTWDTESVEDLDYLKQLCGVDNVCVSHFEKSCSINYQRTTSLAGIKRAMELGCEYILKTRTDQRIYASRILSLLIKMWKDFPIRIVSKAKGRIVVNGVGTLSDRFYDLSDMFVFGHKDDVLRYFSCPKDNRDIPNLMKQIKYENHLQYNAEYSKLRDGEIWFATHYLESLGYNLKWTFDDSDYYRNELYIIIDDSMLDLYWPKYTQKEYRRTNYYTQEDFHQVSFLEWYNAQTKQ